MVLNRREESRTEKRGGTEVKHRNKVLILSGQECIKIKDGRSRTLVDLKRG